MHLQGVYIPLAKWWRHPPVPAPGNGALRVHRVAGRAISVTFSRQHGRWVPQFSHLPVGNNANSPTCLWGCSEKQIK